MCCLQGKLYVLFLYILYLWIGIGCDKIVETKRHEHTHKYSQLAIIAYISECVIDLLIQLPLKSH